MNHVVLMGRLTADPETTVKQTAKGDLTITRFNLAVDRRTKTEEKSADFFKCTAFGGTAEVIDKYLRKGSRALISGRLQQDEYTKKDGTKVSTVSVVIDLFDFVDSKKQAEAPKAPDFMDVPWGIDLDLPFK